MNKVQRSKPAQTQRSRVVSFVCSDCPRHTGADAVVHPAELHFHPGGDGGHEVHHLHGTGAAAEGQSGSSWRDCARYRRSEAIQFRKNT